jgi:hypothetical protein
VTHAPEIPALAPDHLPRTAVGDPAPRDRTALRAVLRQEGAWVGTRVLEQVSAEARPESATDPRWFGDEVTDVLDTLWRRPDWRGRVIVWPDELARLHARDVPPGVLVVTEGYGHGVLRRGTRVWPFVVDASFSASTTFWDGVLSPWSYLRALRAAAHARGDRVRDVEVVDDTIDDADPRGATLHVRVRLRERRADEAFDVAQTVLAALRMPADRAEQGAGWALETVLHELTYGAATPRDPANTTEKQPPSPPPNVRRSATADSSVVRPTATPHFGQLLAEVERMVQESGDGVAAEGFDAATWLTAWLATPMPVLGGSTPVEQLGSADGIRRVTAMLRSQQSGTYW